MSLTSARKAISAVAGVSAFALFLTACGSSSTTTTSTTSTNPAATGGSSASSSAPATSGSATGSETTASASGGGSVKDDDADWCDKIKSKYGDLTGKSVGVYSTIGAPEDAVYQQTWKNFTDCTGAAIAYEGSKEFEAQIGVRVSSGNPPDIGLFPQPGLLKQVVESSGAVLPLDADATANVSKYYGKDWQGYGTVNGQLYGIPNSANFKSLIWYSPKNFKTHGYELPKTYDELIALSDKIAATGEKPWCAGIGSGEATGWPLTDWLEDYVLRTAGPDVYDKWVSHDVKFSDAPISAALAAMAKVIKNPKYVNGGIGEVNSIASTIFQDGGLPILQDKCTFHRQASFYVSNWPKGTKVAKDGDVWAMYFPSIDAKFKQPVLGGGEFYAAFVDRPEVKAFLYYVSTPSYSNARAKLGNWISANRGLSAENVSDPILQLCLGLLQDPNSTFRFDGSDLMPAAVGSDAEWKQMVAWITGQDDATTLANIDAAWPA